MFRKSLAFLPVAFALLAAPAIRSNAQSFSSVTQVGTITQDSLNYMSLSISGYSYDPGDLTGIEISGTINMAGFLNGIFGMNIGAPVKSLIVGSTTINKVSYKKIVLTSKPFRYMNLVTGATTLALMQASIVQYKHGTITFQIIDATTNVTLAATATSDGQLIPVPLVSGSTSIHF